MKEASPTTNTGSDNSDVYSDEETFETFDDLDDDETFSDEGEIFEEEGEEEEAPAPKPKQSSKEDKKEAAKKAKGQKGDDMEVLDTLSEENQEDDDKEDEEETEEEEEDKPKEDEEEETQEDKEKQTDAKKGKPSYVEVGGETFALDSNAIIHTKVDGKTEKVTLQDLKNNYAGKVSYDKKMNEVNLKETQFKRERENFQQQLSTFTGLKSKIEAIMGDATQNPKDAFKIFVDAIGLDPYDLEERMFKADLQELSEILAMEPAERKAYLLEKKTSHLLDRDKKREAARLEQEKRNSYQAKTDQLRKSYNVSEAQYVDAYEELLAFGNEAKDISEQQIVEWAATKPHRAEVRKLLQPYDDQFDDETYGELSWKLSKMLLAGQDNPQNIAKNLKEVYGTPSEVKELSKQLKPLGRKPANKGKAPLPKSKAAYESFDDIEDDE